LGIGSGGLGSDIVVVVVGATVVVVVGATVVVVVGAAVVVVVGATVVVVVGATVVVVVGAAVVVVVGAAVVDVVVAEVVVVGATVVVVGARVVVVGATVVVVGASVVVVGGDAAVTTSSGLYDCSRDFRSAPSDPFGFASTKAKVPLPVTALVTSNSTQRLAGRPAALATTAPFAGAVFQVMPFSVQTVPVLESVTPWLVPFEPTRRRTLALSTGVVRPVVVNFRYEFTTAFEACSTRSGSVSKLLDGRFCSTRASAVAMNATGAMAPPAGIGLLTAMAPAATTTAATNVRAQGARRGETDNLRGSQPQAAHP
jgi:hypothetical protein